MPAVKPLAEFNRNQSAVIDELQESGQPIYLTRNGSASIVVMDAEAFDREMSYRTNAFANEIRVYNSLMKGYLDVVDENLLPADKAECLIMKNKGWQ